MGNININNISCSYNVCLDDLYEVDWFSEKNWKIDISNEIYRNNYIIKKGKFILSNMKDVNIILMKKINVSEKNIKNLLLPFFINFKSKCEFNILINLSNENNEKKSIDNINNIQNNIFTFNIKCFENKIYLNDIIFENNNKNLLNIFFNFEHKNILSSKIVFVHDTKDKEDKENTILQKNNLYYDNEHIYLSIIIQINKLDSNEYIKLNL
jgi:hypothetical protein